MSWGEELFSTSWAPRRPHRARPLWHSRGAHHGFAARTSSRARQQNSCCSVRPILQDLTGRPLAHAHAALLAAEEEWQTATQQVGRALALSQRQAACEPAPGRCSKALHMDQWGISRRAPAKPCAAGEAPPSPWWRTAPWSRWWWSTWISSTCSATLGGRASGKHCARTSWWPRPGLGGSTSPTQSPLFPRGPRSPPVAAVTRVTCWAPFRVLGAARDARARFPLLSLRGQGRL